MWLLGDVNNQVHHTVWNSRKGKLEVKRKRGLRFSVVIGGKVGVPRHASERGIRWVNEKPYNCSSGAKQ